MTRIELDGKQLINKYEGDFTRPVFAQVKLEKGQSYRLVVEYAKVMARPNLMEIIDKYQLYADDRERLTSEQIYDRYLPRVFSFEAISASFSWPPSHLTTTGLFERPVAYCCICRIAGSTTKPIITTTPSTASETF